MESRRYPKFPIPGVGAIVVSQRGILLVRRDKEPGKGLWSIPGGGVEIGETVKEAIIREVKEESGIDIDPLHEIGYADIIMNDNDGNIEFQYILIHFLARALNLDTKPETPEAEVAWFMLDELPRSQIPQPIIELIRKNNTKIRSILDEYEKPRY
jgi:8-oxo-dGTP diphosphatase